MTASLPALALLASFFTPLGMNAQSSTTTLVASPATLTIGQSTTLKATIKQISGSTPSGKVEFSVSGVTLGSVTTSNGAAAITATSAGIPAGTYPVVATYTGSDGSSKSAAVNVVVQNATPTGTALSSCKDITTSGTYYLSANVSSSRTCFFIDADNVTLNLNGHTITYGTGGGTAATPGIMLADPWYNGSGYSIAATGTTQHHGGFVVYGGNITSATNAAQRSAAIWVGQSNDISPAPVIHDTVLTTYAEDAAPILGTVSTSGFQIYNNTINYASKTISSRYDMYGYAIWIADDPNAAGVVPDQIYNNKIIGAPQGGVFDNHQNAQIHNNDITFNSYYTNDYCVANVSGNGQVISNNNCHPTSGRGVDVEAANTTVSGNTITVIELPQNAEYGGCELSGTYGIRIRDNAYQGNPAAPKNVTVSGNTITATAAKCMATGLESSYLLAGDSVKFASNVVTTTGGTKSVPDYAIGFEGDQQPTLTFTSNTLKSVYAAVGVGWDGANVQIGSGQTWSGTPLYNVDNENGFYAGSGNSAPTFTQSIVVENSTTGKVNCGPYAGGLAQFGSTAKTCN